MKKIIFLCFTCFIASNAWATPYITIIRDINMGSVLMSNPAGSAQYTLSDGSVINSHTSGLTIQGYQSGSFTLTNDASSSQSLFRQLTPASGSSTVLTCSADCQGNASSCSVTFKGTKSSGSSKIAAGASWTNNLGGQVNIPANCGTGLFTGTMTVQLREKNQKGTLWDTKTMAILLRIVSDLSTLTVTNIQDMNFGTVSTTSAHNVTINPQTCAISSTVPSGILISNTAQCGIINIENSNSSTSTVTSIQLPANITLSGTNGGTMSLDITSYPAVNSITSVTSGNTPINIGGTLHVLGTEAPGTYSGNYTLTVNY